MSELGPHELGVAALGRALAARELSSVEVTSHLLDRFAGHERLGTALSIDREGALAQAAEADRRRAAGASGPLLGVPIAHKDIFVTRGQPTTAGSRMLEQLNSFFRIVEQMSAVETSGVEPLYTPLATVQEAHLRLRADEVSEAVDRDANQRSAPATRDGLYLVPKVIE